jgi:cell division protein FtsN
MSRDYAKNSSSRKKIKKKSSYFGLWLFILLIFIAFTIALVYFGKTMQSAELKSASVKSKKIPPTITKNVAPPHFDFYTLLPQKKAKNVATEYTIEISTVNDYATADRAKAELTLLGFTVNIKEIQERGMQKYFVTVGPYDNKDAATLDLERLKRNKIYGKLKKIH